MTAGQGGQLYVSPPGGAYPPRPPGFYGYGYGYVQPPVTWENNRTFAAQLGPEDDLPDWTMPGALSGVVPLRPLSLGDILTGVFRAVRFNSGSTMGLAFLVSLGSMLVITAIAWAVAGLLGFRLTDLGEILDNVFATAAGVFSAFGATSAVMVGSLLVSLALAPALSWVIAEGVATRRATPGEAFRRLINRLPAALGFGLIAATVVGAGIASITFLIVAANDNTSLTVLVPLAFLGMLVLGAWLGIKTAFALPVIGVEGVGPLTAIRRSWLLTRRRWWRTLGISMLIGFIVNLAGNTVQFLVTIIGMFSLDNPAVALGVTLGTTVLSWTLTLPLYTASTALLYTDARIRDEGLDLALTEDLVRTSGTGR